MADVTSTFAAKDVGFTSTVNRMQRSLAGFQSGIAGFAAKAAGLVTAFVGIQQSVAAFNKALSMGGRLDDLSKTTGATAGELLLLEKAFELAGSSADAVGPAIARLNRFMVEASNGGAAQVETMNKLGLSYDQLKGRTPTEQMQLLAKSIMALPTPAQRTAAAMDIFGRSGSTLIPLFANFSGELDKAQGYLGSLPGLMDQSAGAMADMEDDIGALGDKFNQFVAGLVAGAAGADNFASALAKIDTAGIGANLGEQLRVAFDAPLASAKAIGYTLLTGAQMAGNALINGSLTAADLFVKTVGSKDYAEGIGLRIRAGLLEAVNAFNKVLASSIKTIILEPFASLPGLIGDPFRAALKSVESIQATLDATSRYNYDLWNKGGELINGSVDDALTKVNLITKDWLGVEQSASDAARHMIEAQEQSRQIREDSEKVASNFGEGSNALTNALNDIRGFDLKKEMGPDTRPDWTKSNKPPPSSASQRIAAEEAEARATNAPRGGGGSGSRPFNPTTDYGRALRERGEQSVRFDPATSRLSSTGLAIERTAEQFSVDKVASGIRSDLARLNNKLRQPLDRAQGFEDRGMFGAAERLRARVDRRMAEKEKELANKYGLNLKDQAKTPEERKAEEQAMRDKHAPSGGAKDPSTGILEKIHGILETHMKSIDEKLPQHALAA